MLETLFTCEEAQHEDIYVRKADRPVREGRREDSRRQSVKIHAPKQR